MLYYSSVHMHLLKNTGKAMGLNDHNHTKVFIDYLFHKFHQLSQVLRRHCKAKFDV